MSMPDIVDHWMLNMKNTREQELTERSEKILRAVESLKLQMCLRGPNEQQLEKYPAVREAWERYLTIAALHGINNNQ